MKTLDQTPHLSSTPLARKFIQAVVTSLTVLGLWLASVSVAHAAAITKAGTGTDLNAGASWTGSAAPTDVDVATWDSTSLGAGLTLAAGTNWQGVSVSSALTAISITGAGPLTLGVGGFDLSAAATNMTVANSVILGTNQTWNVNLGRLLTVGRITNSPFNLTKSGAGTNAFGALGASTIGGTLDVTAGVVQIGINDFICGGLTGSGTVENGSATTRWIFPGNTNNQTFSGTLQNGVLAGRLGLNKSGAGKLTLSGVKNLTDQISIRGGIVELSGPALAGGPGGIRVVLNDATSLKSILTIATDVTATNIFIGDRTNAAGSFAGAVYQTTGNVRFTQVASVDDFRLGSVLNGQGYYKLSGGTLFANEMGIGGSLNDTVGVMDMTGGTVTNNGYLAIARGGLTSSGVLTVSGGTFLYGYSLATGPLDLGFGSAAGATAVLNVGGGAGAAAVTGVPTNVATTTFGSKGLNLASANVAGTLSVVNLITNGTLTVCDVTAANANPSTYLNFNGGTLKATAINLGANFMTSANIDGVYVYGGGATIDNNGTAITSSQQLRAPTGSGVTSIPVTDGGAGYVGAPMVRFTDGSGASATAIANMVDDGLGNGTYKIGSITVTIPGDYTSVPTIVTLKGGSPSTNAILGAITTAANASGGLIAIGSGSLTLTGGYTFTNTLRVLSGTLALNTANGVPSPAGDVIVSNATLTVDASSGTAMPANNVSVGSTVNLTGSASANGINAAGSLTLGTNTTLNIDYGTLTGGNPTAAAINVAGGFTAPGTNIVVNINGFGLAIGQFALIDYTGAALSGAQFANLSLGTLPPGVAATLSNNVANTSIDLVLTSTGQNLYWRGVDDFTLGNDSNWNINTTTNWLSVGGNVPSVYLQYTNGASIVGDPVLFDDNVQNSVTNINLAGIVRPFTARFDTTLPYSVTGLGAIAGVGSVVKTNTGSVILATTNSYSGGTFVYQGSVIITNDAALGTNTSTLSLRGGNLQINGGTTNNLRPITVTANSTLGVLTNTTAQFGGTMTGAGGLTKIDNGTLTLAGSNAIAGNLVVSQGTLKTTGTNNLPALVTVANTASVNAVLNIAGGVFNANLNGGNVFNSSLIIGGIGGTAGSVQMTGGTLNIARQLAVGGNFGEYAGFSQSAGTTTLGGFLALGLGSDQSVFNLTGGTFGFTNLGAAPPMTIGAGTTATYTGIGIATVSGSAVLNNTNADGSGGILWIGETARGEFNLLGSAAVNLTNSGVIICKGNGAGQAPSGTLNLNGGTLTTTRIFKTATGGSSTLNFNGGTLKASAANSAFISGLGSVAIYTNGATIDDSGFAVTLAQPLLAPAGYGVLSISLSSGGSGYIDSPIVTISGGTGSNATAIATVVGGVVTGLTVTSPGTGYNVADVLTASLSGGGGSGASPNTPVLVVNFGGGLTKKGAGTTSLAGVDTYTGTTAVSAGTLLVTPLHQVTGAVTVASNATYGVSVNVGGAATNGNLTLGSTALDITTLSFGFSTGTNPTSAVLQTGTLTRNGTNRIRLSGLLSAGTFPLVKYSGALAGSGVILTNALVAHGIVATISNDVANSTLYAVVTGTAGIVWQGYNTAPALTNLWNLNSATNWLSAGSPSDYTEVTPPGDPVLFDDTGSGLVLLSNTVSPAGLLLTNNAVSYTFQGSARIAGTTSLIKMGTGTATVTLTNGNNYTGNTIISNGTLQCGTAVTIPDGTGSGSTIIGSAGTLQLNGFSETLNGLVGSGVIDNSGGGAVTLTVGNGGGSAPWAGTITNTGAGAVNILKTGTGSMTISGTNYLGGGNSQMNGGTNFLTATGRIEPVGTGEFWVMQNAGTARMEINGGSLNVNSWLVIGRNIATANGTLVINSGTVQKGGANNVVVGSLNATGRLEVNGGQLLNNGNLWLGENASANATLQLNGGLVQATQVRPQGVNPVLSVAYFNGGIMQAYTNSDDFFGTNATAMRTTLFVSSGGLYFDTQSFSVTNQSDLLDDGSGLGGLVKLGSGLLAINSSASTYVGVTTVSNGTLNVNGTIPGAVTVKSGATLGGNGTIGGVVTVSAGGTLGAGASIGLLTLGSSPVLGGSVVAEINNAGPVNDQIVVTALPITYAGALVVSNVGAVLTTNDTFTLFTASAHSGAFTTITNTGTPLDPGLGLRFTNGVLSVVSTSPSYATNPTNLTSVVSGSTLTLSWPADHLGWFLQTQTNSRALGLKTNWFDVAGSDTNTTTAITMDKASPTVFFRLRYP